jgi:hypothetical protein
MNDPVIPFDDVHDRLSIFDIAEFEFQIVSVEWAQVTVKYCNSYPPLPQVVDYMATDEAGTACYYDSIHNILTPF